MGSGYVLSLHPTFTQGLILGQLSVLVLLALILKYLFLESTEFPFETSSYHPRVDSDLSLRSRRVFSHETEGESHDKSSESAEWFTLLLQQVSSVASISSQSACSSKNSKTVETYRSKLRDDIPGVEGDEIARQRIEAYANLIRPPGFVVRVL